MKTQLIKTLRERLDVSEDIIPDDKILTMTNGSILRTAAELEIALNGFKKAMRGIPIKTFFPKGGRV